VKILLSSYFFAPAVGGLATVSSLLAREFGALGHEVIVVTETKALPSGESEIPFEVYRGPTANQLARLVRWSDIYFHSNISLTCAWPLLMINRPWVIAHHIWLPDLGEPGGMKGRMKRLMLHLAANISVSRAVADSLNVPSHVIGNPYNDSVFMRLSHIERVADLIFVGRVISDKGIDLVLQALARLAIQGLRLNLTIVGDGPDMVPSKALCGELKLEAQVRFVGVKTGIELVELLNQHEVQVVPSRWNEPFGVVALEGIACGCVIVGSNGGGLLDAIGPCGLSFRNGDVMALAQALTSLFRTPELRESYRRRASEHLAKHSARSVAQQYLDVFDEVIAARSLRRVVNS
jgi:glycosyltransferase involved in cell wall biosynthesis